MTCLNEIFALTSSAKYDWTPSQVFSFFCKKKWKQITTTDVVRWRTKHLGKKASGRWIRLDWSWRSSSFTNQDLTRSKQRDCVKSGIFISNEYPQTFSQHWKLSDKKNWIQSTVTCAILWLETYIYVNVKWKTWSCYVLFHQTASWKRSKLTWNSQPRLNYPFRPRLHRRLLIHFVLIIEQVAGGSLSFDLLAKKRYSLEGCVLPIPMCDGFCNVLSIASAQKGENFL